MKNNALIMTLLGLGLSFAMTPTQARTIVEIGNESEIYYDEKDDAGKTIEYKKYTNHSPYVTVSHTPNNGEWNLWARLFKRIYPYEEEYKNNIPTGMTDRAEFIATKFSRTGNLRLRPAFGMRYDGYDVDRKTVEYRFYPSFDYFLTNSNRFYFSGFGYVSEATGQRSGDKKVEEYNDWGLEYETGYLHYFNANNNLKVGVYGEYDSFENSFDNSLLQLRVMYDKKMGRTNIKPYIQYGLWRTMTEKSHKLYERWGNKMDKSYDRVGIETRTGISGQWGVIFNAYWQIETNESYNSAAGGVIELPDRDKLGVKFGVQYVF